MSEVFLAAVPFGLALSAQASSIKKRDPKPYSANQGGDIRGTISFQEISQQTGVPMSHFQQALNLDRSVDARKPMCDWIRSKGTTMQHVREAVKFYKPAQK